MIRLKTFIGENKGIIAILIFCAMPEIISLILLHEISVSMLWLSVKIALCIAFIYFSVKISIYFYERQKLREFQLEAYGVAQEICERSECSYGALKFRIDSSVKYRNPTCSNAEYEKKMRLAFFSGNIRRFVYLSALDYVSEYAEGSLERQSVEKYCSLPPSKEQNSLNYYKESPFWWNQDVAFAAFGVSITVVTILLQYIL